MFSTGQEQGHVEGRSVRQTVVMTMANVTQPGFAEPVLAGQARPRWRRK